MSDLDLRADGVAFIARQEGFAGHPYWPKGNSGITLDVGDDLGQRTMPSFVNDYMDLLPAQDFGKLLAVVGLRGADAEKRLREVVGIKIPRELSLQVFRTRLLPRYAALCQKTFPGVEKCYWQVQAALTSLVYNRGGIPVHTEADATDSDLNDRYQDERLIVDYVREGNVVGIANALDDMGRKDGNDALWPGDVPPNPGLRAHRHNEAALVRAGFPA